MYILNRKKTISIIGENDPSLLPFISITTFGGKKREASADETAVALAAIHPEEISTAAR